MPAVTSQPEPPAWDVDADWWGPTWDVVKPVGPAEAAVGPANPRAAAPGRADQAVPVPATSYVAAAEPSWRQVLATTISLWAQRHRSSADVPGVQTSALSAPPGVPSTGVAPPGLAPRVPSAPPGVPSAGVPPLDVPPLDVPPPDVPPADVPPPGLSVRRPRVVGWASAVWGAHARPLSAAVLSAGLLAAGAGTVGLVMAHVSSVPSARLAARPSPVAVPSGRTLLPVSLSAVAPAPEPVWLTIPALGVKAPIVTLGLNRNGTLQVPSSTKVVGWYTNSPRPGATGSAVIAGHVDSRSGPGVFFWLHSMHRSERIYVRRADGTLAVFTVTAVRTYAKARFPTATVYGPVPDAELRLITCGGTFDYARGSYLSNVVVYARLSG
jgi:sortase family protein